MLPRPANSPCEVPSVYTRRVEIDEHQVCGAPGEPPGHRASSSRRNRAPSAGSRECSQRSPSRPPGRWTAKGHRHAPVDDPLDPRGPRASRQPGCEPPLYNFAYPKCECRPQLPSRPRDGARLPGSSAEPGTFPAAFRHIGGLTPPRSDLAGSVASAQCPDFPGGFRPSFDRSAWHCRCLISERSPPSRSSPALALRVPRAHPAEKLHRPHEADTVEVWVRSRPSRRPARASGSFYREIKELNPGILGTSSQGPLPHPDPKGGTTQFAANVSVLQSR